MTNDEHGRPEFKREEMAISRAPHIKDTGTSPSALPGVQPTPADPSAAQSASVSAVSNIRGALLTL